MAPFRAPREAHERPRRIWTDSEAQERIQQQNLRALEARRLAIPPLFNPYPRGIKLMSEREANEVARHGEVLRWSSDSDEEDIGMSKGSPSSAKPQTPPKELSIEERQAL